MFSARSDVSPALDAAVDGTVAEVQANHHSTRIILRPDMTRRWCHRLFELRVGSGQPESQSRVGPIGRWATVECRAGRIERPFANDRLVRRVLKIACQSGDLLGSPRAAIQLHFVQDSAEVVSIAAVVASASERQRPAKRLAGFVHGAGSADLAVDE